MHRQTGHAIEKAVVLCAGEGSRLRPLTFSKPKHLLPVAGRPILGWALDAIRECGIRQAALIIGHQAEAVRRYVGAGDAWDMDVTYIPQMQPLGLGHAVSLAREYVDDEPFLVYLGDNLFERGICFFLEALAGNEWEAALLLKAVDHPEQFGVAVVEGERIVRVIEKPARPPSDLAIVGVYAFQPGIFDAIYAIEPSARGELEITDAIARLIETGRPVRWSKVEGLWEDTGEPGALLRANHEWLTRRDLTIAPDTVENCRIEGPVGVETGTRVSDSHLIGPCLIGRNCIIADAVIGPDVAIDDGCEIIETRLRNCVVQRNTQVRHVAAGLVDSVIGEHVEVQGRPGDGDGPPLSLLLGDMARMRAR